MPKRRRYLSLVLVAFALAAPSAAGARAAGLVFASIPKRFVQGAMTTVVVSTRPSGVICNLSIRFSDGVVQSVGQAGSASAKVKWSFRVDGAAAPGHARVTVSCARAGTIRRTVLVVGSVIPARIVVDIGRRQKHALKMAPISNIYIEPSVFEPAWVGAVDGEVSNASSSLVLQNTSLSTVLFDSAGNVLGGGSGFAGASLPPGARE